VVFVRRYPNRAEYLSYSHGIVWDLARGPYFGLDMNQLRNDKEANLLVEGLAQGGGNDLVRFIARRLRSVGDARDLAHEAYVRLLRVKRKDLIRDPQAYLYRIAVNILYEFELKRKADTLGLARCAECQIAEPAYGQPEDDVEALQTRKRIEAVLAGLSPKCRAVFILYRRDGLSYKEIGARIGISTNMVKKYLAQGLRHCREHLAELR
jgi:RNA polymerase sigma-19 factor, ECF subfamily